MNPLISIKAPAKINLTLDVTGQRPDGYHELRMIMQTIDLCDEITIEKIPEKTILFSMEPELPDPIPPQENLVWKAADLMKETFALPGGFRIHLKKQIPAAAGLAGGSADCAATLLGINTLCDLQQSLEQLCGLGVALGADVPFCIRQGTMLSEGIGDVLTPLPPLPPLWALLIKPAVAVSTAYVYTHLELDRLQQRPDTDHVIDCIRRRDMPGMAAGMANVLETVTIPLHPMLARLKQFLSDNGAIASLMSGSGPTVYGLYQDEILAQMALQKARAQYGSCEIFLCQARVPKK